MDDLDHQIVGLLQADGRQSIAELGRRVGLSRTATLARVRRLEADGVILGYHARVVDDHPDASHAARVGITLRTPDLASYVRRLQRFPELREVETVAGDLDLLVRLEATSAARLDAILDRINGWKETRRTTTFMVLGRYPGHAR